MKAMKLRFTFGEKAMLQKMENSKRHHKYDENSSVLVSIGKIT